MPQPKIVYKYDIKGNLLTNYDSINLAAKRNNMPVTCIRFEKDHTVVEILEVADASK